MTHRCTCNNLPQCAELDPPGDLGSALLASNLKKFGWSPIATAVSLKKSQPSSPSPSPCQSSLENSGEDMDFIPSPTREAIHQAFEREDKGSYFAENGIEYRGDSAESGDPSIVEPKESLEVNSRSMPKNSMNASTVYHEWFAGMHHIALQIQNALHWPAETLLCSTPGQRRNEAAAGNCLDLLRIFYYHQVDEPGAIGTSGEGGIDDRSASASKSKSTSTTDAQTDAIRNRTVLGSSPHTDWGSLTIVWQDHIGGLQTWCHACQRWIDVPASDEQSPTDADVDTNSWRCIVHVGDITSLILPRSRGRHETPAHDDSIVTWPSPKHRVVSPRISYRASLVYFAYPPSYLSMDIIRDRLKQDPGLLSQKSLEEEQVAESALPYGEYYLLRDQSPDTGSSMTPNEVHGQICGMPIGQVLQHKWGQVQR